MAWSDILGGIGSAIGGLFGSGASDASTALVSEPGFDWGSVGSGFADLGKGLLGAAIPAAARIGTGVALGKLFPGDPAKTRLTDVRNPAQLAAGQMAHGRALNLMANPTGFGLPGDPNDPNTPAGKRRYDIIQGSRAADAARGQFRTGGSAARETAALNAAVGNEYDKIWQGSMGTMSAGPGMAVQQIPAQPSPWGAIAEQALSPAISRGISALLTDWGLKA
jgi:hypothetical protein